jgi:Phosphodiester glycosidase
MKRFSRFTCLLMTISGFLCYSSTVRAEITVTTTGSITTATLVTAIVTNVAKQKFITPIPSRFPVNKKKLQLYNEEVCVKKQILQESSCKILVSHLKDITNKILMADDLGVMLEKFQQTFPLNAPLYTINEWFDVYKEMMPSEVPDLMVNANWFNVDFKNIGRGYPHKMPVTAPAGYIVSHGMVASKHDSIDTTNRCLFDALIVKKKMPESDDVEVNFVAQDQIGKTDESTPESSITAAVAGFLIYNKGEPVTLQGFRASCNSFGVRKARTGIGLAEDRQKLIVVVWQPGPGLDTTQGWKEEDLIAEMKKHGAKYVFNLDNSGSSQFRYVRNGKLTISVEGDTLPAEIGGQPEGTKVYRPVPNFFGIKEQ